MATGKAEAMIQAGGAVVAAVIIIAVGAWLAVKRHPELTPRRHRKLTPEETAYVAEVNRGDVPSVS